MRYEHKHEREKYSTTTIQVSAELSCDGWLLVVLLCLAQQRESSQSVGLRKGKERREKTWHCRSMLDLIQCVVAGAHHGRQKGQHHARRELMTIGAHRCEILCDRPTGGNRWRFNICHFGKFFLFLFFKDLDFVAQPVNLDGNYVTNRERKAMTQSVIQNGGNLSTHTQIVRRRERAMSIQGTVYMKEVYIRSMPSAAAAAGA